MPRSVLIIEDHEDTATTVRAVLSAVGFECVVATSADEGLRLFSKKQFCVVITDIGMTEKTGYDVAEAIRKTDKDTPILAATGYDQFLVKPMAERVGINHVLSKPLNPSELVEWVVFLCTGKNGHRYVKSGEFKRTRPVETK